MHNNTTLRSRSKSNISANDSHRKSCQFNEIKVEKHVDSVITAVKGNKKKKGVGRCRAGRSRWEKRYLWLIIRSRISTIPKITIEHFADLGVHRPIRSYQHVTRRPIHHRTRHSYRKKTKKTPKKEQQRLAIESGNNKLWSRSQTQYSYSGKVDPALDSTLSPLYSSILPEPVTRRRKARGG